jgi:cytochrome c oxidase subunit II
MGGTAIAIAVFYSVVVVISVGVVIAVAASTIGRGPMDEKKAAHRERNWLLIVIVLLVVLLFGTIFFIPYGKTAPKGSQVVDVTAFQFGWLLSRQTVRANVPVEFVLHSKDVNHDFGVYNAKGVYQFQVGIVPNYTQKLVHTFKTPGRYDVLCLEYCGLDHAKMQTSFQVVP